MSPNPPQSSAQLAAAQAFRHFFGELRAGYLERDALFTQIELALLCREHVLVMGPPGTAKSAIAGAVLSRITDEKTGAPSLFAKQLSESTVQTDLIGPVDFKVLTETGRTEYLTDDGMLGAAHAFLDEVFDGRDMLLRSILNVLHERELKHGRRVTEGRTECAIMTSNRYLSEVLARSPELLLAFADRLSFICFVPKSFARPESRAAMLQRASLRQRLDLRAPLTLQQLHLLQLATEKVQVSSVCLEALELLGDELERALQQQVTKLPDYVPTKYFSQRSMVKALWALKAAVVRDQIYRAPDRRLEAVPRDLEMLRYFFLLGGPNPGDVQAMLKSAVDPRERAQLEIVRLEHQAFDEALEKVRGQLSSGVDREAAGLKPQEELSTADVMTRNYQAGQVSSQARALREKLVPGPRHPANRAPLVHAAAMLATAAEQRLARGMAGQGEGRGGVQILFSFAEVIELCRVVPELRDRLGRLARLTADYCGQALEMIGLAAESTEFEDGLRIDGLAGLATNVEDELTQLRELLGVLDHAGDPTLVDGLRAREQATRQRVATALRRRATTAFQRGGTRKTDAAEALVADSRRLVQLERALGLLVPGQRGLREELLAPLGQTYARDALSVVSFNRVEQFSRVVRGVIDNLRREGISPERTLAQGREVIAARLGAYVEALRPLAARPVPAGAAGEGYVAYREHFGVVNSPDGELAALVALEQQLGAPEGGLPLVPAAIRASVATAELSSLQARVNYLREWLTQLLTALPDPAGLKQRTEAEKVFDRLVKSRFPLLALKEGELLRLEGSLGALRAEPGEVGEGAQRLIVQLRSVSDDFGAYSRRLLEARAAL